MRTGPLVVACSLFLLAVLAPAVGWAQTPAEGEAAGPNYGLGYAVVLLMIGAGVAAVCAPSSRKGELPKPREER